MTTLPAFGHIDENQFLLTVHCIDNFKKICKRLVTQSGTNLFNLSLLTDNNINDNLELQFAVPKDI